jgi:peptidoglycan/LPS O-acetylase OafA/YrhL
MIQLNVLPEFFTNYEATKLHIDNPYLLNSLIYATLLFITLVTLKKKKSTFLDFSQTEQLRGLAILFVIIEHFWYHVCNEKNTVFLFGGYAVTLFLLLSGYGLMRSNMAHQITAREFFLKRIRKIFIPYWLATIGIAITDYLLWQKRYPLQDLFFTFTGINISKELQYFDHSRWFITLLLVNYLTFFCCAKLWKPLSAALALVFFSFVLILLRRYELFPLGARHQLIAFPLGCLMAVIGTFNWLNKLELRHNMAMATLISLAMFSIYLIGLRPMDNYAIEKALTYLQSYLIPFLFCLLYILSLSILASAGYISQFLGFCGYLSYELYLIHGPFLIKYNPTVGNFENIYTIIGLSLWFGIALGLANTLKAGSAMSNRLLHLPTA